MCLLLGLDLPFETLLNMTTVSASLTHFFSSSIGRKWIVAVTGAALLLFLLGHMAGNLLLFMGAEAFNEYAHFLKHMLHGAGIWIARIGLLVCFVLHVTFTILLAKENRQARPQKYQFQKSVQSKNSTKLMLVSGLIILSFVIYHILHFTVTAWNDYETFTTVLHGHEVHDAYKMVIVGFRFFPAALFYVIAMALLCSHLHHGFASVFQTLGVRSKKNKAVVETLGKAYALVIFLGFISIPLAVQTRLVNYEELPQQEAQVEHADAAKAAQQLARK